MAQNIPTPPKDLRRAVMDLSSRIGTKGSGERHLGIIIGPLAFDNTDDDVKHQINDAFDLALETGVAVGFHIDDSMFWGRLKELNTPANIEWSDWQGTLNTGRRLDWSSKPAKIMPQLCFNSDGVKAAVVKRAALIGREIAIGEDRLRVLGKEDLFLGVIAGWETQIGRDYATGKSLGYCALRNAGYSETNPPVDMDTARSLIVRDYIGLWSRTLADKGVPPGKVFSHISYISKPMYQLSQRANPAMANVPYLQAINFTPPAVAFCEGCNPGFSTYPQPGSLEQWQEELTRHAHRPWASSEGTAIDPFQAEKGGAPMSMEGYLGNLYNHGATLVNIFGWGVGDRDNPFRTIAESSDALEAYRKFLHGESLKEEVK